MKLNLTYPYFKDMIPFGLSRDKRAHACWYYAVLAQKNFATVGKGPESQIITVDASVDDTRWLNREYVQIARSVATLYGLPDPDSFFNYKDNIIETGENLDPPVEFAPEIWRPLRLVGLNS